MDFLCFKKYQHDFFRPKKSIHLKDTYNDDKLLASALLCRGMEYQKLGKSNRICGPALVLLVLDILSRSYETRELLLLPCMTTIRDKIYDF